LSTFLMMPGQHLCPTRSSQKMIQCSSCYFRCAMCGMPVERSSAVKSSPGLTFCEGCRQEFEEYQDISRGKKQPELFWHNKEWQNIWSSWLGYRRALSEFMKSRGFKLLIEEMDGDLPGSLGSGHGMYLITRH